MIRGLLLLNHLIHWELEAGLEVSISFQIWILFLSELKFYVQCVSSGSRSSFGMDFLFYD